MRLLLHSPHLRNKEVDEEDGGKKEIDEQQDGVDREHVDTHPIVIVVDREVTHECPQGLKERAAGPSTDEERVAPLSEHTWNDLEFIDSGA